MKRKILICLVIITGISLFYFGCEQKTKSEDVVATINNYQMTAEDLKDKIVHSPHSSQMAKDLEEFLDVAIREQILIQEAQRQGLDREKTFMKTIERYWGQALIKELLDKQSKKIYEGVSADKRDTAMKGWMDELYKKADVRIYKDVLNNKVGQGK
ncbi:hypothetical protein ACFL2Y_00795 [Candidatus Omnitrophota bacterium]